MKANKLFNKLCNSLFPCRCPYCNSIIQNSKALCEECYNKDEIENIVTKLINSKNVSPYKYDGVHKEAILRLKFNNCTGYAEQLAMQMSEAIKNKYSEFLKGDNIFHYITYVPCTKKKLRKRGFNQSQLLAKYIAMNLDLEYFPVLIKTKENDIQHNLPKEKRKSNVEDVFDVDPKYPVKNKRILLIDDILTTGSTLNECVKVLHKNGAKNICCATYTTVVIAEK